MSGPTVSLSPGDITEQFGAAEAMRLVSAGFAVVVKDEIETAVMPAPAETRVRRKGKS